MLDALRDPRFSSERIGAAYGRLTEEQKAERQPTYDILMDWLVFRDPPDHTRLRRLVSREFTPKAARRLAPRIAELAGRIVDAVIERGSCDFVANVKGVLHPQSTLASR